MRVLIAVLVALLCLSIAMVVVVGGLGTLLTKELRSLAYFYLRYTFNEEKRSLWTSSPEAVNAILWDYRGLDTLYETVVLYTALLGCLVLAVKYVPRLTDEIAERLTPIARASVKLVLLFVFLASLTLAFKGYVTPGGGFQGGAAFATVPFLILAAFSIYTLTEKGFRIDRAEVLRCLGLLAIATIAILPTMFGGYFMQNQAKEWIAVGAPPFIGPIWCAGTILFYNLSEFIVVSAEFIAIAIVVITLGRGEEDAR